MSLMCFNEHQTWCTKIATYQPTSGNEKKKKESEIEKIDTVQWNEPKQHLKKGNLPI